MPGARILQKPRKDSHEHDLRVLAAARELLQHPAYLAPSSAELLWRAKKMFGTSSTQITNALLIREQAPELWVKVVSGETTVYGAYRRMYGHAVKKLTRENNDQAILQAVDWLLEHGFRSGPTRGDAKREIVKRTGVSETQLLGAVRILRECPERLPEFERGERSLGQLYDELAHGPRITCPSCEGKGWINAHTKK